MSAATLIMRMGAGVRTLEVPGQGLIDLLPLYTRWPEGRARTEGEARELDRAKRGLKAARKDVIDRTIGGLRRLGWFPQRRDDGDRR